MIILHTKRLQLRQLAPSDSAFILELQNTPKWKQFISDRGIDTLEKAQDFLVSMIIPSYEKFGFGFYLLEDLKMGRKLGICGLVNREGLSDIDIGYALLPHYEGQGYAIEAAEATLKYGFETHQLERIVAITHPDNQASISLLKKLGLIFESMISLSNESDELMLFSIANIK